MRTVSIYIILGLFLTSFSIKMGRDHAIYLSVAELNRNQDNTIHLRLKLFSDDLQSAVRNFSDGFRPAPANQFFEKNSPIVIYYLQKNFRLYQDGSELDLKFVNFSIENDAHFIEFKAIAKTKSDKFSLKASYLIELFPEQKNIVEVLNHGQKQYLQFQNPVKIQDFTFSY